MESISDIAAIQKLISNRLDESAIGDKSIAGIIGDGPSHYSKSPALWNAAFSRLAMNAIYVPFDVDSTRVGTLLRTLRNSQCFMGVNVTVPHKVRVIDFLDELDGGASRIGAVNTIVKNPDGKLIGYNTDGEGFIDSLLLPSPGQPDAFMHSLDGMDVLLLGAGGSARAVAFHLSDWIGHGKLIIANRTREHADSLAGEIAKLRRQALAINELEISDWAARVGLIVNCTTKGQGGVRKLTDSKATILEPYSALAPANPPLLADGATANFEKQWYHKAQTDIAANNQASQALAKTIPPVTRFYDMIYHPDETVFLRHGQSTGHRTMNGKSMIVHQAVRAFCKRICLQELIALGKNDDETFYLVTEAMFRG
ncbi:MAG TPA: shikimate dehydrogenase [Candidatus Binatia bacterium]